MGQAVSSQHIQPNDGVTKFGGELEIHAIQNTSYRNHPGQVFTQTNWSWRSQEAYRTCRMR